MTNGLLSRSHSYSSFVILHSSFAFLPSFSHWTKVQCSRLPAFARFFTLMRLIFDLRMLCALGLFVLGGCGLGEWLHNGLKVGPNYKPLPAAVASDWIDYKDPRVTTQEQDLSRWWTVFRDPVLDGL